MATIYDLGAEQNLVAGVAEIVGFTGVEGAGLVYDLGGTVSLVAGSAQVVSGLQIPIEDIGTEAELVAQSATLSAIGFTYVSGASNILAGSATMTGSGKSSKTASGSMLAGSALITYVEAKTVAAGDLALSAGSAQIFGQTFTDVADPIWDTQDDPWNKPSQIYGQEVPLFVNETLFLRSEAGTELRAGDVKTVLERVGLTVAGKNSRGDLVSDETVVKFVGGIWPLIKGSPNTVVKVYVGFQMNHADPIEWEGPRLFHVGVDTYIDVTVSGRYISVRFESEGQSSWELLSYDLDITPTSQF